MVTHLRGDHSVISMASRKRKAYKISDQISFILTAELTAALFNNSRFCFSLFRKTMSYFNSVGHEKKCISNIKIVIIDVQ
jgi:hypothetical protein